MPSYLSWVTPEQAWDLVHYLRALQGQNATKPKETAHKDLMARR